MKKPRRSPGLSFKSLDLRLVDHNPYSFGSAVGTQESKEINTRSSLHRKLLTIPLYWDMSTKLVESHKSLKLTLHVQSLARRTRIGINDKVRASVEAQYDNVGEFQRAIQVNRRDAVVVVTEQWVVVDKLIAL